MVNQTGDLLLQKEILLESGTNEVEILVFQVGTYRVGINVAKVREIMRTPAITELPKSHPSVLGCFHLRHGVVACVSLHRHLKQPVPDSPCQTILTEFNFNQMAFVVDRVEKIHRVSWEHVVPLPELVMRKDSPVTAVTRLDDKLVVMLDFETIAARIAGQTGGPTSIPNPDGVNRHSVRIVVVDDSATVRHAIESLLRQCGFEQIHMFNHGGEAWAWLEAKVSAGIELCEIADVVVSDVEMPVMDGLHLTKRIKEHPILSDLPVVLCSSILTPDNEKKGAYVGADAQVTKPDLAKVVALVDRFAPSSCYSSQDV